MLTISAEQPWLAPLAGYSDLPFRLLCRRHGCCVAVTEMVSAKGLIYGSPGTEELLRTEPGDVPLVVQLFGAEEAFLLRAVEELRKRGFLFFDLNCGCSVRKVAKTGSGAALLKEPAHLVRLAKALTRAVAPGCMGFKVRLGWGWDQPVYLELGQDLEAVGAGWITLHPRFATQGFSGEADWSHIRRLKARVSIPVIASGDLLTAEEGVRCIGETGADSLMFARGALGDPAIFERYRLLRRGGSLAPRSCADMRDLVRELGVCYREAGQERTGLLKMRTLAPRFFKNIPGAKVLRREIVFCKTWEDVYRCLDAHIAGHKREEA